MSIFARWICYSFQRNYSSEISYKTRPYKLHKLESGPSDKGSISKATALELYNQMYAIRTLENVAMGLYRSKKIRGFCHLYTGQEAIAVGIYNTLRPQDTMMSSYRIHGWAYLITMSAKPVMGELFGTTAGIARGKGGSMHMYGKGVFGGSGIVGAQVPQGAGLALAHQYKKDGGIALSIYGDGAANQGQVFESYNIAKLWSLPCVFLCENNHFGMGTSQRRASASNYFYTRGDYVPGLWVDGNDIFTVIEATKFMIDYCTSGKGPLVVEASTYRYTGHSMSDPDTTYRTREDIQEERKKNDPLNNLKDALIKHVSEDEIKSIENKVKEKINQETEAASKDSEIPLEEIGFDIYIKNIAPAIRGVNPWKSWKTGVSALEKL